MRLLFQRGKNTNENGPDLKPGLILLGINLLKLDGLDVLEQIISDPELRSVPVVMLTTSGRDEEVRRSYTCGANSYITRPVNFHEFVRKVREVKPPGH